MGCPGMGSGAFTIIVFGKQTVVLGSSFMVRGVWMYKVAGACM